MKAFLSVAAALLLAGASVAEPKRAPLPPAYADECGSCHVPFPGRMLDAASWSAVLAGLPDHFGVDASADAKTLEPIRAYLEANARGKATAAADGRPLLRITDTRWFRHEHDEIPRRLRPGGADAVRPSDCTACHTQAAAGRYAEREIRLPQNGGAR